MKILVEVYTDLAFKNNAEDLIDEIMYGGIDMLNHSPDIKEGISWNIVDKTNREWDPDANI